MNALAARWESSGGKLIGGGARGSDDQDFGVRLFFREERGGAFEQRGIGAGVKDRARDHR
jgi:hypothetical protein